MISASVRNARLAGKPGGFYVPPSVSQSSAFKGARSRIGLRQNNRRTDDSGRTGSRWRDGGLKASAASGANHAHHCPGRSLRLK